MTVDQINMKITQGSMRPRSATAPTASATLKMLSVAVDSDLASNIDVRDRGEHALVNSEHEIRDLVASNRRCSENISETNVLEVTNVFAGRMREGKGVTPKEPLEGRHTSGHHGEPYQRES